jgi:hypothetical protein
MIVINKILTYLTHSFFGIEELIWVKIDSAEKQKFNAMSFSVLLVFFITLFGMYEFFILLVNSDVLAVIFSVILTIILINIIRFSVFTIQNPIYYVPEIDKLEIENTLPTIDNTSIKKPNEKKEIITPFKNKLVRFISFFSIELVVRTIINGVLLVFIALPFACFLKNDLISKINENNRELLIDNFKNSEEIKFKSNCNILNNKINVLNRKTQQSKSSVYISELKKEQIKNAKIIAEWKTEKDIRFKNFKKNISETNFIILSYKVIANTFFFKISLLFLGFILFLSHYQKQQLVNQNTYSYYKLVNKYYYEIALENYKSVEELIKVELSKKYSNKTNIELLLYNYESLNSKYVNPPFNSKEIEYKAPIKQLTSAEFINNYV